MSTEMIRLRKTTYQSVATQTTITYSVTDFEDTNIFSANLGTGEITVLKNGVYEIYCWGTTFGSSTSDTYGATSNFIQIDTGSGFATVAEACMPGEVNHYSASGHIGVQPVCRYLARLTPGDKIRQQAYSDFSNSSVTPYFNRPVIAVFRVMQ